MTLKGHELWNHLEKEARRKFKKDDTWELRAVEIIDDEIARVTLRPLGMGAEETGLVVYKQEVKNG